MIITRIAQFASRNSLSVAAFIVGSFIASAGIVAIAQHSPANAASNETNIGTQVITVGKTKTTTVFNVCKISKGSGYYTIRVRAKHSSAVLLANAGYRLNIGSSHGSTTSANKYVSNRFATTTISNKGKIKSSATVSTFLGKGSSAGYTNTKGTTLRSFTAGSVKTC